MCRIESFGAPSSNEYRLVVEGQVPISLQTTMVSGILMLYTGCAGRLEQHGCTLLVESFIS